jgi:hypothetical protein
MGNRGFTFNQKEDEVKIKGFKPYKKVGLLTDAEKYWKKKFLEVQVIVENAIHVIKVFKILSCIFWHRRDGKVQSLVTMF